MQPNWGPAYNPGTRPERQSNWWPIALWDNAQPTTHDGQGVKKLLIKK